MRSLRLLLSLQLVQLRSAMAYRADFWIGIVGAILQQCVSVVFLVTFFSQVGSLAGWTIAQVAILHGLVMISSGLVELFGDGVWQLRVAVSTGTFDRVLVRPISPAIQQMGSLASIHGVGNAGMGVALLSFALPRADVDLYWWLRVVLTFLLPYATITYLPTSMMLGRGHWWWALGPVLAAGWLALLASLLWRRALNVYQGVGH